jgi:hypothetical protein
LECEIDVEFLDLQTGVTALPFLDLSRKKLQVLVEENGKR